SAAITGDSLHESQKSWTDIPSDALSGSQVVTDMISAMTDIRRAIDQGCLEQARRLAGDAWEQEVLFRDDNGLIKVRLLELRAEISELQEDWENAADNYDEAWRIRQRLAEEAPSDVLRALQTPTQEGLMVKFFRELK